MEEPPGGKRKRATRHDDSFANEEEIDKAVADAGRQKRSKGTEVHQKPAAVPTIKLIATKPIANLSREERSLIARYDQLKAALEVRRAQPAAAEPAPQSSEDAQAAAKAELLEALAAARREEEAATQRPVHRPTRRGPARTATSSSSDGPPATTG
jgi:hypothetical protein